MGNRLQQFLVIPFRSNTGINKRLVMVFLLMHGIVLFNAICHDPRVGYDAGAHLQYINVLSEFTLPTPDDSREFFSPPLPYFLPALLYSSRRCSLVAAAKFSQLLNVSSL